MTFTEHLLELRKRIIYSLLGLFFTIVVGLVFFQNPLFRLVLAPHQKASRQRASRVAQQFFGEANGVMKAILSQLAELSPGECYAVLPELQRKRLLKEKLSGFYVDLLRTAAGGVSDDEIQETAEGFARKQVDFFNLLFSEELVKSEVDENIMLRAKQVHAQFEKLMEEHGDLLVRFLKIKGVLGNTNAEETAELFPTFLAALDTVSQKAEAATGKINDAMRAKTDDLKISMQAMLNKVEKCIDTISAARLNKIVAITYTEQFFSYLKIVLIFGLFLSSPFLLYQMWLFVGAGLYEHEQKVAILFIPFSLVLFVVGMVFGYYVLVPIGLSFLSSYGDPELISPMLNLSAYLSLFFTLTLLLGLVFQEPLIMFFLSRAGIVSPRGFAKKRRHAILTGVILGAFLTPPDPFTQLMLAIPLICLYEIGIMVSRTAYRKAPQAEEA